MYYQKVKSFSRFRGLYKKSPADKDLRKAHGIIIYFFNNGYTYFSHKIQYVEYTILCWYMNFNFPSKIIYFRVFHSRLNEHV